MHTKHYVRFNPKIVYKDSIFYWCYSSSVNHFTLKVLLGFLVGNDFVPHLPDLHIINGALPLLYKIYKQVLPTLDGEYTSKLVLIWSYFISPLVNKMIINSNYVLYTVIKT